MPRFTVSSNWKPIIHEVGGIRLAVFRDPVVVEIPPKVTQRKVTQRQNILNRIKKCMERVRELRASKPKTERGQETKRIALYHYRNRIAALNDDLRYTWRKNA